MINATGLLEVDGMVAAVDAADAMLKAANVRLLSHQVLDLAGSRWWWRAIWRRVVRRWMPEAPPRSAQAV